MDEREYEELSDLIYATFGKGAQIVPVLGFNARVQLCVVDENLKPCRHLVPSLHSITRETTAFDMAECFSNLLKVMRVIAAYHRAYHGKERKRHTKGFFKLDSAMRRWGLGEHKEGDE